MTGGGDTPSKTLRNGKYKFDLTSGAGQVFAVFQSSSGRLKVWASSLEIATNINVYGPTGNFIGDTGANNIIEAISHIAETYDNFRSCDRKVVTGGDQEDWDKVTLFVPAE